MHDVYAVVRVCICMSMCNEYMTYTNVCLSTQVINLIHFLAFPPQYMMEQVYTSSGQLPNEGKEGCVSVRCFDVSPRLLRQFLNQPLVTNWPNFALL